MVVGPVSLPYGSVALLLVILDVLLKTYRPQDAVLGLVPGLDPDFSAQPIANGRISD
jgi:hypothetical protein